MKVAALYTWAPDPGGAVVLGDGTVQWRSTRMTPGEDDAAVLDVARDLASDGGEVVGVTIGDGDTSWGLARGAATAVSVPDAPCVPDEAATAAVLAAAVRTVPAVDVVLVADAERHPGVAASLAGHLGWPVVLGITAAGVEGGELRALRRAGDVEETLAVATPAVLGITARSAESRTPGMKEQLAARKRPVRPVPLADLDVPVALDRVTEGSTRLPATTPVRVFDGDPVTAVRALVAALRTEGVL